jgi:hypothetical protein
LGAEKTNIEPFKVLADLQHKLFRALVALRKIVLWCIRLG